MNIYVLKRMDEDDAGYDENCSFVIRAESAAQARRIANLYAADEGKIWDDKYRTYCLKLNGRYKVKGKREMIVQSFNAG